MDGVFLSLIKIGFITRRHLHGVPKISTTAAHTCVAWKVYYGGPLWCNTSWTINIPGQAINHTALTFSEVKVEQSTRVGFINWGTKARGNDTKALSRLALPYVRT